MKTRHLSRLLSCIAIALAFTACGDNAIEAETEMQSESFAAKGTAIDKLDKQLDRIDYFTCTEKYNSIRCNSFYAKYGSFEAKEIADTLNYDDHAVYILATCYDARELHPDSRFHPARKSRQYGIGNVRKRGAKRQR